MVRPLLTKVHVNISTAQECLNKVGLQRYNRLVQVMLG